MLQASLRAVDGGGNAARARLKPGDQVLYTTSFFGDELWPTDKLGFTKTAIQAKPDSIYFSLLYEIVSSLRSASTEAASSSSVLSTISSTKPVSKLLSEVAPLLQIALQWTLQKKYLQIATFPDGFEFHICGFQNEDRLPWTGKVRVITCSHTGRTRSMIRSLTAHGSRIVVLCSDHSGGVGYTSLHVYVFVSLSQQQTPTCVQQIWDLPTLTSTIFESNYFYVGIDVSSDLKCFLSTSVLTTTPLQGIFKEKSKVELIIPIFHSERGSEVKCQIEQIRHNKIISRHRESSSL
ncbi:hypothetical protein JHK87_012587 [Glycine soja]|nr:hypothetical protein JHK87_012587 [Glycine soja]